MSTDPGAGAPLPAEPLTAFQELTQRVEALEVSTTGASGAVLNVAANAASGSIAYPNNPLGYGAGPHYTTSDPGLLTHDTAGTLTVHQPGLLSFTWMGYKGTPPPPAATDVYVGIYVNGARVRQQYFGALDSWFFTYSATHAVGDTIEFRNDNAENLSIFGASLLARLEL